MKNHHIKACIAAFLVAGSILVFVGILERLERERSQEQNRAKVLDRVSTIRARLEGKINQQLFLGRGLVSYISTINPNITQEEFETFTKVIIARETGIYNIALYKNTVISHVYPFNKTLIGFDPRSIPEERAAIAHAIDNKQTIVAGPIKLFEGGTAFIARTPIFLTPSGQNPESGSYWGLAGIVIYQDTLFKEGGLLDPQTQLQYAIRGKDGTGATGEVFFGNAEIFQQEPVTLTVTLPNGSWQLAAIPQAGWSSNSSLSVWLWIVGAAIALLAGSLVFIIVSTPGRLQEAIDRANETLAKQNQELQHLDQLKDEFLANTSHELRTPLNGIIGIAESLIDGATGELTTPTQTNLQLIVSSGRRLSSLINDILDFSKLRHNNLELQLAPIDLRAIVNLVLTLSQPLAKQKSLQLINGIPEELPNAEADENRLQQILHNLIGNAIKFTNSGIIEISAQVISPEGREILAVTVSDTGIGIPEDKFERIFQSFEQAEGSTAREYGGTGLGLAVTKQLVELHSGEISVRSQIGVGSQFTFTLPLSQAQAKIAKPVATIRDSLSPELMTLTPLQKVVNLATDSKQFKILIVDDEPINRQVLINNLSLYNYAITEASNGQEALAVIENGLIPDLVLLDLMMPRMTGYEVCQKIRERFPAHELPIVMLTAKNQIENIVEGFTSGANDYLAKPVQKQEMLARMRTHLNLAKLTLAYGRFVPRDFLNFLGKESIIDVQIGNQIQQEMTVMFADIRSFTTLSEAMTPQETFNFINAYLSRVSPAIREHQGFIDKYIGDAIMALFPQSADEAVQAAISMQQKVAIFNQERQQQGLVPISIGIGLHTGNLMLGTIGEPERMETTVISDAVNLASRFEGLTKLYGAGILISVHTLIRVEEVQHYGFRFLDRVRVKGKNDAVAIYELYETAGELSNQLKTQTKSIFEAAVMAYNRRDFVGAQPVFEDILVTNPQDKAAMLYVKRCQQYLQYGVPEGWDGVTDLDFK